MKSSELQEKFEDWQKNNPSPLETNYKIFIRDIYKHWNERSIFEELFWQIADMKMELQLLKENIDSNNAGLYD